MTAVDPVAAKRCAGIARRLSDTRSSLSGKRQGERSLAGAEAAKETRQQILALPARPFYLCSFPDESAYVFFFRSRPGRCLPFASDAEIAARFDFGEKRMRAVIREILARRVPAPPEAFVAIKLSRLNEALLVAYSAMSPTNLEAVDQVAPIVRALDRYHGLFAAERRRPGSRAPGAPAEGIATFGAALVCRAAFSSLLPCEPSHGLDSEIARPQHPSRRHREERSDAAIQGGAAKICRMPRVAALRRRRRRPLDRRVALRAPREDGREASSPASASTTARHSQGAPRLGSYARPEHPSRQRTAPSSRAKRSDPGPLGRCCALWSSRRPSLRAEDGAIVSAGSKRRHGLLRPPGLFDPGVAPRNDGVGSYTRRNSQAGSEQRRHRERSEAIQGRWAAVAPSDRPAALRCEQKTERFFPQEASGGMGCFVASLLAMTGLAVTTRP
ncbi:hypothetical protein DFR50_1841 [Roseiarcus fermentans]|uniref:Uncharacterized protein n=1 Tax=Roseiarcus fermentans TaxID=1473586 RepID=A0A366ECD3_9HYPH|nr:hypothetical protein [Roseiarcus fermentans]RBP00022.1 hypothetical protein DFR50_1841 [Roseiarcus fermentans]